MEGMKVVQEIKPVSFNNGIVDVGQNIAGWLKVRVRGQKGDTIIIMSYADMTPEELRSHTPKVVLVDAQNHLSQILSYEKHGEFGGAAPADV